MYFRAKVRKKRERRKEIAKKKTASVSEAISERPFQGIGTVELMGTQVEAGEQSAAFAEVVAHTYLLVGALDILRQTATLEEIDAEGNVNGKATIPELLLHEGGHADGGIAVGIFAAGQQQVGLAVVVGYVVCLYAETCGKDRGIAPNGLHAERTLETCRSQAVRTVGDCDNTVVRSKGLSSTADISGIAVVFDRVVWRVITAVRIERSIFEVH